MKITIKKINNGLMTSMGVIVSIMFFYSYVASMHYMMINEGKLSYGTIMFQLLYILGLIYLLWLISYIIVQRKEKKETKTGRVRYNSREAC